MRRSERTLACDLTLLSPEDRERLVGLSREIFTQASEVDELPNGYALGFRHASPELLAKICDFIALDRRCCSFLRHELVSEPGGGTTWLRLTGEPGAKELISGDVLRLLARPLHPKPILDGA